ncbi:MAG: hypothetical protein A2857_05080 [Candidatus Levybacteria bacterium RIFCSPHIGHO2_01_FULL_36_15]|nr:MAG: hypothetical protein A2857_05080 [Candidatus Levybacteria bacterium RIFCSPHIGHO2_01_FULL_36_15]OGH38156.1 MAG: hypothetical protein A2905_05245 [Candidatus Levybacteria bacterium RIFCSPLOWO2_01_FULL_36_10]
MTIEKSGSSQHRVQETKPLSGLPLIRKEAQEKGAIVFTKGTILQARVVLEDNAAPQQRQEAGRLLSLATQLPIRDRIEVMQGLSEIHVDHLGNVARQRIENGEKR